MREEKKIVRSFYDTFGWKKKDTGIYNDTATFVDNRPVMYRYNSKVHRRVGCFLNPHGKYLLDAASGAVPFQEYIDYSAGYQRRICVDFSLLSLYEARDRLGTKGLYIMADVCHLPFRDAIFDGIVSLHTIYHVPADEQKSVIKELARTLKTGGKLVIVTIFPSSRLTDVMFLIKTSLRRIIKLIPFVNRIFISLLKKIRGKQIARDISTQISGMAPPTIYFFPREITWWKDICMDFLTYDIRIWRTVDLKFSDNFVPNNWLGRATLWLIYVLETIAPHFMVYVGRYPMIIVNKK